MEAGQLERVVVVGVDGSQCGLRAARWAAAEAARRNAPLRVVMAFGGPEGGGLGEAGPEHRSRDVALGQATGALAEAACVAERVHPSLAVQRQLVVGSPIAVLTAQAREAQLMVVGDRGLGGGSGSSLGSVAAALGTYVVCPLVVVRGGDAASDEGSPIVVGVDGPSTSDAAIAFAFEAAATRGVALMAVHTWWELLIDTTVASMANREAVGAAEREALDERLVRWCAKYPQVPVQRLVQRDLPAHALVERSRAAQLVVVGSRGRGWLTGMVLGSVSHTLLHRAHCPVAVVRGETAAAT